MLLGRGLFLLVVPQTLNFCLVSSLKGKNCGELWCKVVDYGKLNLL